MSTAFKQPPLEKIFTDIADYNAWGSKESVSGTGSELCATVKVREWLPRIIDIYGIKSILDAPCGDVNWMKTLFPEFQKREVLYAGMDIVERLIEQNGMAHETDAIAFVKGDITEETLPRYDLIFMRDVLGHLSNDNIFKVLKNVKDSGAKWLLTTTFPNVINTDGLNGGWRLINLLEFPYQFNPELIFNENCMEGNGAYDNKCMALFDVSKIDV